MFGNTEDRKRMGYPAILDKVIGRIEYNKFIKPPNGKCKCCRIQDTIKTHNGS